MAKRTLTPALAPTARSPQDVVITAHQYALRRLVDFVQSYAPEHYDLEDALDRSSLLRVEQEAYAPTNGATGPLRYQTMLHAMECALHLIVERFLKVCARIADDDEDGVRHQKFDAEVFWRHVPLYTAAMVWRGVSLQLTEQKQKRRTEAAQVAYFLFDAGFFEKWLAVDLDGLVADDAARRDTPQTVFKRFCVEACIPALSHGQAVEALDALFPEVPLGERPMFRDAVPPGATLTRYSGRMLYSFFMGLQRLFPLRNVNNAGLFMGGERDAFWVVPLVPMSAVLRDAVRRGACNHQTDFVRQCARLVVQAAYAMWPRGLALHPRVEACLETHKRAWGDRTQTWLCTSGPMTPVPWLALIALYKCVSSLAVVPASVRMADVWAESRFECLNTRTRFAGSVVAMAWSYFSDAPERLLPRLMREWNDIFVGASSELNDMVNAFFDAPDILCNTCPVLHLDSGPHVPNDALVQWFCAEDPIDNMHIPAPTGLSLGGNVWHLWLGEHHNRMFRPLEGGPTTGLVVVRAWRRLVQQIAARASRMAPDALTCAFADCMFHKTVYIHSRSYRAMLLAVWCRVYLAAVIARSLEEVMYDRDAHRHRHSRIDFSKCDTAPTVYEATRLHWTQAFAAATCVADAVANEIENVSFAWSSETRKQWCLVQSQHFKALDAPLFAQVFCAEVERIVVYTPCS